MGVTKNNRLYYWLAHQAEANPDKTFIRSVDQNSLITYREFYQTCCKISEFFKVVLYCNDYKFLVERSSNQIDFPTFQYNLEY